VSTLIRRWRTAFGFLLLFLLWEVGVHVFAVHEYILPPPSQVLRALIKNWQPVLASAGITTLEIVAGYALAIVVSIPLAIGIVFSRTMEETVYPIVVFLQIIPKIAVAPSRRNCCWCSSCRSSRS
jgi:NitT/TauT family transport system permease protein